MPRSQESRDARYLIALSEKVMGIPPEYGTDQSDYETLREIAARLDPQIFEEEPMPEYHVRVLSGANVVQFEEDVSAEELHDAVTRHTEDYIDIHDGYTLEITAND